ncbi:MAG TPA: hypothetical protein VEX86_09605 [Longimicrobium sp.]|nr:hypothetical protein [Longimicrobium sp.]
MGVYTRWLDGRIDDLKAGPTVPAGLTAEAARDRLSWLQQWLGMRAPASWADALGRTRKRTNRATASVGHDNRHALFVQPIRSRRNTIKGAGR